MARRNHLKLKIISLAMAAAMLSGCAHRAADEPSESPSLVKKVQTEETAATEAQTVPEEIFYNSQDIILKGPDPAGYEGRQPFFKTVSEPQFAGDRILVSMYYSYDSGDDSGDSITENYWAIFDLDGTYIGKLADVYLPSNAKFARASNGDFIAAYDTYDEINGYGDNSVYVARFNANGELIYAPNLVSRGDYAFVNGVAVSDEIGTLLATDHDIFRLDEYGSIIQAIDLDYSRKITSILEENGTFYLMLSIGEADNAETCDLYEISAYKPDELALKPVNRNADNLLGMKIYQNPGCIYSATRNALGKLDVESGEFSRLLDWNQTDLDRSILLFGSLQVISEGELSQTVTMLPKEERPGLSLNNSNIIQPSVAPDFEEQPEQPYVSSQYAPSDSVSEPEDFIDDPTTTEDTSSTGVVAPGTSDAKTEVCITTIEYTDLGNEAHLIKLEPAASNPHSGQDVVWVGGVGITDSAVMKQFADFNLYSKDVWVKVVDYADFRYNGGFETKQYMTKAQESMLTQINSGVGPDIIFTVGESGQFDNNNTLTDLNAYVDGINGIDRSKYFDNVFRAFETNGKLYQIPLGFQVHAMVGNTTMVDGKTEMNYHDFTSSNGFLDDGTRLLSGYTPEMLLNIFVEGETGTWINYATDTVSVDHSSLIDLLELLRLQKQNSSQVVDELMNDLEIGLDPYQFSGLGNVYDGSAAFCPGTMNSVYEYASAYVRGEETRWYGYPGSAGCTPLVDAPMTAGIAAYSTQKEKAWEVIRYLLGTEAQVDINDVTLTDDYYPMSVVPVNIQAVRDLSLRNKASDRILVFVYCDDGETFDLNLGSYDDMMNGYIEELKKPFRRYIRDEKVLNDVRRIVDYYLDGEITVTEAADTIEKHLIDIANS